MKKYEGMGLEIPNENKINYDRAHWEAKQNATGFFSLLLKVAKRNPKLWKQICNEKNEDNRDTNNTN